MKTKRRKIFRFYFLSVIQPKLFSIGLKMQSEHSGLRPQIRAVLFRFTNCPVLYIFLCYARELGLLLACICDVFRDILHS